MLPLAGVTVVALEQAVAAPFATRQLADLGARVIKVERPPDGDFARRYDSTVRGMSSHFVWLNRNKESVVLDLKDPGGRRTLTRLLDRADVLVQNLAPGAAERLGVDPETLARTHPQLIACAISGYGSTGPYRDKKAYDLLVQCEAGLLSITGTEDEPAKAGIPVADIAAGMYAYSGVLSALYERERTERGSGFEVSMLEALAEWMGYPYQYTSHGGTAPARTGARHAAIAPYGPFTAGDGARIFLAVQNHREWLAFCGSVLEQPALAEDPRFADNTRRVANQEELTRIIEVVFGGLTGERIVGRLEAVRVAHARMRTVEESAAHPQLDARDRWHDVDTPVGPVRTLLPPVTVAGRRPRMEPVPGLGEHTESVLLELSRASRS